MGVEYRTMDGHFLSEEDFLFNMKWEIWQLVLEGRTLCNINEFADNAGWSRFLDVETEVTRIRNIRRT